MSLRRFLVVLTTVIPFVFGHPAFGVTASAQAPHPNSAPRADPPKTVPAERRFAFIVGNESYAAGALPTAANDAGLVAQTLQAAGFEVVGARDLDAETLRQSYADFLRRLGDAGQDTVAFVYLAGYALQYANDNYYVPIGANVSRDLDIPVEAVRLSDLTGPLDALNLKARFMVFDAAYKPPFKPEGAPLAGGLALVDASPGSLIAYNAAPGTVAAPGKGNYGVYAQSLAAMLREGGLPPDAIFDRVRLRVNAQSKGAAVPWDSTKIDTAFRFFDRGKGAPPAVGTPDQIAALQSKPLKDLPVQQAYNAAIARDTLPSYIAFDAAYGNDPLGKRVRVLVAVRREAQTWQRTVAVDSPDAYWSYLSRYPRGAHAAAARLRLRTLSAAIAPPDTFKAIAYDVPPPPADEAVYIDQPVVSLDDPAYDLQPPPPPPDYWLPPEPVAFVDLPPPPPPVGLFFLPIPAFVPVPDYDDPPPFVAYPADNYFYGGGFGGVTNAIHRAIPAAAIAAAVAGGAIAAHRFGVGLPDAVAQRSTALARRGITTPAQLRDERARSSGGAPGRSGAGGPAGVPASQRLPGADGRALPAAGRPGPGGNALPRPDARPVVVNRTSQAGRAGQGGRDGAQAIAARRGDGARRANGMPQQRTQARRDRVQQRQGTTRRQAQGRREPIQQRPRQVRQAPRQVRQAPQFAGPQAGGPGGFGGGRPAAFGGFGGGRPGPGPAMGGGRPGGFGGGRPAGPRPGGGRGGGRGRR